MSIDPNRPISEMIAAKPCIAIRPPSLLVIINLIQLLLPTPLLVISMTNPGIAIAPTRHMMTVCNQCSFCNDTDTIEWAGCKMHNPATGAQTAKDCDALEKAAKSFKHCVSFALSDPQSDSPPHCNRYSRSTYHVDNSWCSSWQCSCSSSH